MRREDFEHVVAAARGSKRRDRPGRGRQPGDPRIDLYPFHRPEKADEIDGSLGDGSWFHRTHGYYARGVGPETASAPAGWEARLVRVEIPLRAASQRRAVAFCLEPHDLVLAKCVAGRERDWDFAREALAHDLGDDEVLLRRVDDLPVAEADRRRIREMLEGIQTPARHP